METRLAFLTAMLLTTQEQRQQYNNITHLQYNSSISRNRRHLVILHNKTLLEPSLLEADVLKRSQSPNSQILILRRYLKEKSCVEETVTCMLYDRQASVPPCKRSNEKKIVVCATELGLQHVFKGEEFPIPDLDVIWGQRLDE